MIQLTTEDFWHVCVSPHWSTISWLLGFRVDDPVKVSSDFHVVINFIVSKPGYTFALKEIGGEVIKNMKKGISYQAPVVVECPVCLETKVMIQYMCSDPEVPHSACASCVKLWMQKHGRKKFTCPMCRHEHSQKAMKKKINQAKFPTKY